MEYLFTLIVLWAQKLFGFLASLSGKGDAVLSLLWFLKNLGWVLSALFLTGIVYALVKTEHIKKREKEELEEAELRASEGVESGERNEQWERALSFSESPNESDWRLAVIEADSMLGAMLSKMGYVGDTIGEQLKGIEVSDFRTIQDAWEAHKVRNQIAHEGMNFVLTKRKLKETMNSYEKVFKEFHFI